MKLGIIGKPQSGKTTIFNAASGLQEAVGDFSQAVHRSVIKVPDERLEAVAEIVQPKKVTHAEIEMLDAPGFAGADREVKDLKINEELRLMEAFILVVDAFSSDASPESDIQSTIDEMVLLDQTRCEANIEKRKRRAQLTGDKSEQQEIELLERCYDMLEKEQPLIDMELSEAEDKMLRGYQMLTRKPLLIVLNIAEDAIPDTQSIREQYSNLIQPGKRELAVVCGKIEMELVGLEDDDRALFLEELGITTPAVEKLIQRAYSLLGLISFFTAGDPDVHAWTIRKGTIAQKAAGAVHTDMERGFIRAEVVAYTDYIELKTQAAFKAAGKMRLEGKEYVVTDGDVIHFRFNV
jgi:GTP-binding protein YchF